MEAVSFIHFPMMNRAIRLNFKPVFRIVSKIVVILLSLLITFGERASQGFYLWQFASTSSVQNGISGLHFFRMFLFEKFSRFRVPGLEGFGLAMPLVSLSPFIAFTISTRGFLSFFAVLPSQITLLAPRPESIFSSGLLVKIVGAFNLFAFWTELFSHFLPQIKTPLYGRSVLADISEYPIKRGKLALYYFEHFSPNSLPGLRDIIAQMSYIINRRWTNNGGS